MITAKVICDSISPEGVRLTTLQLRYPRMIHADFMTHRKFTRNGRSSRAVPFKTLVQEVIYIPEFGENQKGMVAGEALSGFKRFKARLYWSAAATSCKFFAKRLAANNVHKQWVNRMLEWFGYIDVLVTSTDWANFFELRDEKGAQPEIIELAQKMKEALNGSTPRGLHPGEWHMPYININDAYEVIGAIQYKTNEQADPKEVNEILRKISVARCARLTIKPFDGNATIEAELKRYELLMESRPVHASPAEHVATPDDLNTNFGGFGGKYANPKEHGNFYGWRQFRKMIPFNTIEDR